jgi:hypothetical protein
LYALKNRSSQLPIRGCLFTAFCHFLLALGRSKN